MVARPQPWAIDEEALRIAWRGQWLTLTLLEFRMLRLLLSRPARVFSRAQLLDSLHADLRDVSDRAIDSHIKNLRRKIEAVDPGSNCIASVYGVGYRFDVPQ
jgi:two-component system response regulator BaeR